MPGSPGRWSSSDRSAAPTMPAAGCWSIRWPTPRRRWRSRSSGSPGATSKALPDSAAVVDTHCHLGLCEPPDAELVAAAREAGVRRMLTVGIDAAGSREAIAAAERHEEVFACVGRHPNGATGFGDGDAAEIE